MATSEMLAKPVRQASVLRALRENRVVQGLLLISPANLYLFVFMILPLILVVALSFLTRGTYGEVEFKFNAANYARLFDPIYGKIMLFSLGVGLGTTVITILIGYPLAYYIARSPARQRSMLLFLILVPFWTNFVIRTYAWIMILRGGGFLDSVLQWLRITSEPLGLMYTPTAVMIGMVYEFLKMRKSEMSTPIGNHMSS